MSFILQDWGLSGVLHHSEEFTQWAIEFTLIVRTKAGELTMRDQERRLVEGGVRISRARTTAELVTSAWGLLHLHRGLRWMNKRLHQLIEHRIEEDVRASGVSVSDDERIGLGTHDVVLKHPDPRWLHHVASDVLICV